MHASLAIFALVGIASAVQPTRSFVKVTTTSSVTCTSSSSTAVPGFEYCRCSNSQCYDITKEGGCDWNDIESAPEPPLFCPSG